MTCSRCGKKFSTHPCGIDHAAIAGWIKAGAAAERRRTRRAILPSLRQLAGHAKSIGCVWCIADAAIIDRATKAPKRAPK